MISMVDVGVIVHFFMLLVFMEGVLLFIAVIVVVVVIVVGGSNFCYLQLKLRFSSMTFVF